MKRFAVITLMVLAGCATFPEVREARVHHVVLCWLKDAGNAAQRRQMIDVSRLFKEIPGVLDIHVGEPLDSDREIVDDSFDVAISLSFAHLEALQAYLAHPLHQKAKDEVLLPLAEKIVVYDFQE